MAKKLKSVTLSTTEAELMVLCQVAQECLYLKQAATEFGLPITGHIPLYEDNQSTIQIVKNSGHHGRTKHVDVRYHFINELVEQQVFSVQYVSTTDQVADIFTKALDQTQFCALRNKLRVSAPSATHAHAALSRCRIALCSELGVDAP
jgi:hypothetical protein